jgi:hypothetical protein
MLPSFNLFGHCKCHMLWPPLNNRGSSMLYLHTLSSKNYALVFKVIYFMKKSSLCNYYVNKEVKDSF